MPRQLKLERIFFTERLEQAGQCILFRSFGRWMTSNSFPQSRQAYSKMGMKTPTEKIHILFPLLNFRQNVKKGYQPATEQAFRAVLSANTDNTKKGFDKGVT